MTSLQLFETVLKLHDVCSLSLRSRSCCRIRGLLLASVSTRSGAPDQAPKKTATTLAYYSMERGGVGAAAGTTTATSSTASSGLELTGNELCLQDLVSNAHHQQHVHQLQSEHLMQHAGHHLEHHIHAAAAAANHHHEHHVSAATAAAAAMLHNGGAGAHHHQTSLHHEPLEKLKREFFF